MQRRMISQVLSLQNHIAIIQEDECIIVRFVRMYARMKEGQEIVFYNMAFAGDGKKSRSLYRERYAH